MYGDGDDVQHGGGCDVDEGLLKDLALVCAYVFH